MIHPHISVLLEEILEHFAHSNLSVFVDGTLGAGGHAEALLQHHPEIERFVGVDQDPSALAIAEERLRPWSEKCRLLRGNFSDFDTFLDKNGIGKVNGMLLDLGVSSMQLDQAEKGFSFSKEGPLDMRMDPASPLSAAEVVNEWTEEELGRIFRDYGEEKKWRQAARALVKARGDAPIRTTTQLKEVLAPVMGRGKKKGINPLTLVFQAIRIAVNRELEVIATVLPKAIDRLEKGGRLAVISFHSLEDRLVKNAFRYAASDKEDTSGVRGIFINKEKKVALVTRKPATAKEAEIAMNPRSRSAKLRVVEKL